MADILSRSAATPAGNRTEEDFSQQDGCWGYLPTNVLFLYLSVPSFFFILVGSFLKKRKQRKLDCCDGRPAMMQPLDTLDPHHSRRFIYAAAFGMTTQLCLALFLGDHLPPIFLELVEIDGIKIGSIFRIICVILYTIAIYPIFAAIYEDALLGYAVATLYVWLIFGMEIFNIVYCIPDMRQDLIDSAPDNVNLDVFLSNNMPAYVASYFIRLFPTFIYEIFLAISVPARFISCIARRSRIKAAKEISDDFKQHPAYVHVKEILTMKPKEVTAHNDHPPLKIQIRDYLYPPSTGFRYSVRIISTFVVATTTIYMLGFDYILDYKQKFEQWDKSMDSFEEELSSSKVQAALSLLDGVAPIFNSEGIADIAGTYRVFKITFYISQSLALVASFITVVCAFLAVRHDIVSVCKGKRNKIPPSDVAPGHTLMIGSLKYSGLQIGYLIWGFLAHFSLFFLIGMTIGIVTLWEGIWTLVLTFLKRHWVIFLTTIFVIVFQFLMGRFVVTQKGQLALDNRKFYFNLIYVMFFYNIVVGLISCLLRVIKAFIVALVFLPRIDQTLMPERFQMLDPGFNAYTGFINVENAHTHPVLLMFCYFMNLSLKNKSFFQKKQHKNDKITTSYTGMKPSNLQRRKIVQRRYWLWWTLHQNPSLRLQRKFCKEETNLEEKLEDVNDHHV